MKHLAKVSVALVVSLAGLGVSKSASASEYVVVQTTLQCVHTSGLKAPRDLTDAIMKYFEPADYEAACDVTFGESSWKMSATTWCCYGYFQMFARLHSWRALPYSIHDVEGNVKAAASLRYEQGWGPWDAKAIRGDVRHQLVSVEVNSIDIENWRKNAQAFTSSNQVRGLPMSELHASKMISNFLEKLQRWIDTVNRIAADKGVTYLEAESLLVAYLR